MRDIFGKQALRCKLLYQPSSVQWRFRQADLKRRRLASGITLLYCSVLFFTNDLANFIQAPFRPQPFPSQRAPLDRCSSTWTNLQFSLPSSLHQKVRRQEQIFWSVQYLFCSAASLFATFLGLECNSWAVRTICLDESRDYVIL